MFVLPKGDLFLNESDYYYYYYFNLLKPAIKVVFIGVFDGRCVNGLE